MADVTVGADAVEIVLTMPLEPLIAGIDLSAVQDTNEAPEASEHDRLRALSAGGLDQAFRAAWPGIRQGFSIAAGDAPVTPAINALAIPETGDTSIPRDAVLTLTAELPGGDAPVTFGWAPEYGPIIVRELGPDGTYTGFLTNGAVSEPLERQGGGLFGGLKGLFGGN